SEASRPSKSAESQRKSETPDRPEAHRPKAAQRKSEHADRDVEVPFHVLATPATRKLARDLKIDLKEVEGTGPNGRVTKEDVRLASEGQQAAAPRSSHPAPSHTPAVTEG